MRFAHCIAFGDVSIKWLNSISYIMITSFSGSFLNTLLHPLDQCVQKQFQCNRLIALFIRATQIWETAVCLSRFTLRFVQTDPAMALWNDYHCGEGCFFSVPSSCIPAPKRRSACWLIRELFLASSLKFWPPYRYVRARQVWIAFSVYACFQPCLFICSVISGADWKLGSQRAHWCLLPIFVSRSRANLGCHERAAWSLSSEWYRDGQSFWQS